MNENTSNLAFWDAVFSVLHSRDLFVRAVATGVVGVLWTLAVLFAAARLRRKGVPVGYTRKVFHFLIFSGAAVAHLRYGPIGVCAYGSGCSVIVFWAATRREGHIHFEALAREADGPDRRRNVFRSYFATLLGGLWNNTIFPAYAAVGYLVTGLADALAEPVGTRWGRHRYRITAFSGPDHPVYRSLEGSAAVLLCSLAVVWAYLATTGPWQNPWWTVLVATVVALTVTVVEALSPRGTDNFTLQLATGAALQACLWVAGHSAVV